MPSNPDPTPRRGPGRPPAARGVEGREALLLAAQELMAEKGLPRVTAREVAERAGVQPALVNYHFDGKNDLLQAVVERVAAEIREGIRAGAEVEGSVRERVAALVHAVVGATAENPYGPRLMMEQVLFGDEEVIEHFTERFAKPNLSVIRSLLESGRASGEIRDVDPMFLVPTLFGSCLFFFLSEPILKRLFGIEEITPELAERFAAHTTELLLHGLTRSAPETP